MKKLFLISILLFSFLNPLLARAGNPVFEGNTPFVYFTCDRDPTATEPDVASIGIPSSWPFFWVNTTSKNIFTFAGGSSGSMVWNKEIDSGNLAASLSGSVVSSAFGRTGTVVAQSGDYTKAQVGLGNVDDTADASKSFSASQITSGTKTSAFISDFNEASQDSVAGILSPEFVYNDAANTITLRVRNWTYLTPTLNSAAQLSTTRDAFVNYSVDISSTLSLVTGQTGTVFLEYADDSAFTTNVQEVCRFVNGNTGSLTIGLNLTQNVTGTLSGIIPAGKYRRLRTANTTGTPTFTARPGQEVLL